MKMKFKTAMKIEKVVPYAAAILAGAVSLIGLRKYGRLCENIGWDIGTRAALDALEAVDPKMKEDFLECATPDYSYRE